jgi:hypothetical protein
MENPLISIDEKLVAAWRSAAEDLRLQLVAPYLLDNGDGELVWVEGYLPDFGSRNGMVFTALKRGKISTKLYQSQISASYDTYDRNLFIDTLNDWGWFGQPDTAPNWYTGAVWSREA